MFVISVEKCGDIGNKWKDYKLIISEEALHTIMIELHLQVSSFNHIIICALEDKWKVETAGK